MYYLCSVNGCLSYIYWPISTENRSSSGDKYHITSTYYDQYDIILPSNIMSNTVLCLKVFVPYVKKQTEKNVSWHFIYILNLTEKYLFPLVYTSGMPLKKRFNKNKLHTDDLSDTLTEFKPCIFTLPFIMHTRISHNKTFLNTYRQNILFHFSHFEKPWYIENIP